jgi:hypothetical protein
VTKLLFGGGTTVVGINFESVQKYSHRGWSEGLVIAVDRLIMLK